MKIYTLGPTVTGIFMKIYILRAYVCECLWVCTCMYVCMRVWMISLLMLFIIGCNLQIIHCRCLNSACSILLFSAIAQNITNNNKIVSINKRYSDFVYLL